MSRSISVWSQQDKKDTNIEVGNRDLLGTQNSSKQFWSIQKLQDLGIDKLTKLGHTDPVSFTGWEELKLLEIEIGILEKNKKQSDFNIELRDRWIKNLRYCFDTLMEMAPNESVPHLMIG